MFAIKIVSMLLLILCMDWSIDFEWTSLWTSVKAYEEDEHKRNWKRSSSLIFMWDVTLATNDSI